MHADREDSNKPILGYWKIRGLAQQIRLYLRYLNVDFVDILYERGPAPTYCPKKWTDAKHNLGLEFPNLPYYIDGDVKLTETLAIIMYIAEKNGKGGKTIEDRAKLRMVYGKLNDVRQGLVRLCYSQDFDKLRPGYLLNLPESLEMLSKYLADHKWFSGSEPDYPDFNAYDLLDTLLTFQHNCLNDYPNLIDFIKRIEELPNVKEYLRSESYLKWPFNNKIASWGGDTE